MSNGIEDRFSRDDPATYRWIICGLNRNILRFVASVVAVATLVPAAAYILTIPVYAFLGLIAIPLIWIGVGPGKIYEIFVIWIPIVIMIVTLVAIVYFHWLAWKGPREKQLQAQSHLHELSISAIGILVFLMMGPFLKGFEGRTDSFGNWYLFFVDNVLRVVLLDTPDLFGVQLSDIQPIAWLARFATVFLRFLIAAGLVEFLWGVSRQTFGRQVFYGSVKECCWKCENTLNRDTLQLKREARVDLFPHSEAFVKMVDFVEALCIRD